MLLQCRVILGALIVLHLGLLVVGNWLTKEAAEYALSEFEAHEKRRASVGEGTPTNRDSSFPFISGDGFRHHCPHTCDETNRCRMWPERVKNGSCIFVKGDLYAFFARSVIPRIKGTFSVVSHNGDQSTPDGQSDAPRIRMQSYRTSHLLKKSYNRGRLLAHHGSNVWWTGVHPKNDTSVTRARPAYLHCLPIGIEDRLYSVGRTPRTYADAIRKLVLPLSTATSTSTSILISTSTTAVGTTEQSSNIPKSSLLLIAFTPKSRIPDRAKALDAVLLKTKGGELKKRGVFYNYVPQGLSHADWLAAITTHTFVLAPHGHGLDTHRITEILLMGGVPVMKRSSITSCYDDSDNAWVGSGGGSGRGSIPVVVVDRWQDVTEERLLREWARISAVPKEKWDWRRLFLQHWLDRVDAPSHNLNAFSKY